MDDVIGKHSCKFINLSADTLESLRNIGNASTIMAFRHVSDMTGCWHDGSLSRFKLLLPWYISSVQLTEKQCGIP